MNIEKIIKEELYTLTESNLNENFYKWFGGSKVVRGGKPLIIYHGTKTNFNIFKPSKSIGNQGETDQIEGIYFTDNKDAASFFSLSDDSKYLKSVYLSIKNPYTVYDYKTLKNEIQFVMNSEVNKKLISLGHDGLIMENGFYANGGPYKLFLAFRPNQIKSVDNDGTWDINDNNIYS